MEIKNENKNDEIVIRKEDLATSDDIKEMFANITFDDDDDEE